MRGGGEDRLHQKKEEELPGRKSLLTRIGREEAPDALAQDHQEGELLLDTAGSGSTREEA